MTDQDTHTTVTNTTIEKDKSKVTEKSVRITSGDSEIVFVSNDKSDDVTIMALHAEHILNNLVKKKDLDYIG